MGKKLLSLLMIPLILAGCQYPGGGLVPGGTELTAEEEARQIRTQFLGVDSCAGTAEVTADYGQRVYTFTLDFTWQREGETALTLTAPQDLAGLTARVEQDQARLEFDGVILDTGELTGEGLTPLELVPSLMGWVQTGFMSQCVYEDLGEAPALRVGFRDPEVQAGAGAECTVWFSREDHSILRAELFWNGELVLSGEFSNITLGA